MGKQQFFCQELRVTAKSHHCDLHEKWCRLLQPKLESQSRPGCRRSQDAHQSPGGSIVMQQIQRHVRGPDQPVPGWAQVQLQLNSSRDHRWGPELKHRLGVMVVDTPTEASPRALFTAVPCKAAQLLYVRAGLRHRQPNAQGLEGYGAVVKALTPGEVNVGFLCQSFGGTN